MYRTLVCTDMTAATTTIDLLAGGHTDAPVALRVIGNAPEGGGPGPRAIDLVIPEHPDRQPQFADDVMCMAPTFSFGTPACELLEALIAHHAGGPTVLGLPIHDGSRTLVVNVRDRTTAGPHGIMLLADGIARTIADWDGPSPRLLLRALMLARMTGR